MQWLSPARACPTAAIRSEATRREWRRAFARQPATWLAAIERSSRSAWVNSRAPRRLSTCTAPNTSSLKTSGAIIIERMPRPMMLCARAKRSSVAASRQSNAWRSSIARRSAVIEMPEVGIFLSARWREAAVLTSPVAGSVRTMNALSAPSKISKRASRTRSRSSWTSRVSAAAREIS